MCGKIFRSSFEHTKPFLKNQKWTLLMLFVVSFALARFFEELPILPKDENSRIFQQIGLSLISLLESFLVLILFVYSKRHNEQPSEPTWQQIWLYINESVRVLTRVLLWLLAFIIPSFFVYLKYVLVPFVVFFDPDYKEGKVDALEKAASLTKGIMPALFGVSLLFIIFELLFELGPNIFPPFQTWPIRTLFAAASFLLNIYSTVFCYVLFETRRSQLT